MKLAPDHRRLAAADQRCRYDAHAYDGVLDEDLRAAALQALALDRAPGSARPAKFLSRIVCTSDGGELDLERLAEPGATRS